MSICDQIHSSCHALSNNLPDVKIYLHNIYIYISYKLDVSAHIINKYVCMQVDNLISHVPTMNEYIDSRGGHQRDISSSFPVLAFLR